MTAETTIAGLRTVVAGDEATAPRVVVLLHGFDMTPTDLSPFASSMGVPAWYLFPEGPVAAPRGRAWFHIDADARAASLAQGPRDFAGQHPADLPAGRARLLAFLDEVVARAAGRPLVVGGFSQGGMVVCDTLLRHPREVAAVALLSSSRIAFDEWQPRLHAGAARGWRVLVSHGEKDADLAFATGEGLRDALAGGGAQVTWVPFPDGHEIPLVVWRRLRKVLLET